MALGDKPTSGLGRARRDDHEVAPEVLARTAAQRQPVGRARPQRGAAERGSRRAGAVLEVHPQLLRREGRAADLPVDLDLVRALRARAAADRPGVDDAGLDLGIRCSVRGGGRERQSDQRAVHPATTRGAGGAFHAACGEGQIGYAAHVLRVATIVDDTEAEGPGRRWALWVQGCSIRCPGCCNPEMFVADRGTATELAELRASMERAKAAGVEGVSILGGEPFEQAAGVAEVARHARRIGLTVMVYSGYLLEALRARGDDAAALLAEIDLLVDGPYDRARPEPPPPIGRRWIGSTNQTMHYLTSAYRADDPRMHAANTVEIHWRDGKLIVNGWPVGAADLVRKKKTASP
ncbi:MAG: radical SAM protein [Deltaproteobacteria bacterium]|nr:radical SAM protein [Deltaproteobacteria bacterium]